MMRTRFSIFTDNGEVFAVRDRGKVIVRDALAKQIGPVIRRRMAGDAWRASIRRMYSEWCGYGNKSRTDYASLTGWDRWAASRYVSWNNRGRAMVNMLNRGAWRPDGRLHIRSKKKATPDWESACRRMESNYQSQWRKLDEWSKWARNTAGNQRKRMRRKTERAAERERHL